MFGQQQQAKTTTTPEDVAVEYLDLSTFTLKTKKFSQLSMLEKGLTREGWPILATIGIGIFVAMRNPSETKKQPVRRRRRR